MIKGFKMILLVIIALLIFGLAFGCGSGNKGPGPEPESAGATKVGSESCVNTCHARTQDITGTYIAAAWMSTTHTTVQDVQCEDCHGPASQHWGVGPIPFPFPQAAQCLTCHNGSRAADKSAFLQTAHANPNLIPDPTFSQIPTPVSSGRHIQECSRCHNPNQPFDFDSSDNLVKPNPDNLPNPQVSCGSCHDAHQPQQMVTIPQRTEPEGYPIFRKFFVNPTGEQNNNIPGTQLAAILYQPNGAVQPDGSVDQTKVVGKNNELNVERLCAACHTVGQYMNSGGTTHQIDVYAQWTNSGHGTRDDAPFAEFSANPPAYTNPDTGVPYPFGTHFSSYPVDMALSAFGATANTTRNAGNNGFACFHCHNGIGSISWQKDVQGTPDADVVFGDEPVTCITCHETHSKPSGTTRQVRVPVKMTQYSSSSITISGNVFLDNTPLPPPDKTENGIICIFCHQGRESGLTLYATKLAPGKTITGAFFNPHYLGTGAMLWGVNGYEYAGKMYSANTAHQAANCPTCHMDNPTGDNLNGGHTWWPNVATCNVAECHGSSNLGPVSPDPTSENGPASPDVADYRANFDTNNYTGDPGGESLSIAQSIQSLQQKVIAILLTYGMEYDDLVYPYFFKAGQPHTSANAFTAWTPATYKAAFNLSYTIKGLPSGAESQKDVPNSSAAVHDYKYIIQLLQDGIADLTGAPLPGAFRPVGTRPATVYGPGQ